MERVMVFIDGRNFYYGMKNNLGYTNLDFLKFGRMLAGDRNLIRIYYYNAPLDQSEDKESYRKQQRFFDGLRRTDYVTVKLGRLEKRPAKGSKSFYYVEKGVDVTIAVDMLSLAYRNTYDTAILVSGDADFVPVVEEIKSLGKHVESAYFEHGGARRLTEASDRFILLTEDKMKLCQP